MFLFFILVFNSKHFGSEIVLQFFNCTIPGIMVDSKIFRYIRVQINRKDLLKKYWNKY